MSKVVVYRYKCSQQMPCSEFISLPSGKGLLFAANRTLVLHMQDVRWLTRNRPDVLSYMLRIAKERLVGNKPLVTPPKRREVKLKPKKKARETKKPEDNA